MTQIISDVARRHLAWSLVDGVGPVTFRRLVAHFGDAERAWAAPAGELEHVRGVGSKGADRAARGRDAVDGEAETEIVVAGEHGVRILCIEDDEYPAGLREIPDPPIVLYVRGELRETDAVAVGVVGTRKCSIYGAEQARRFGELLAQAGFTVVSGLARGVDAFAHHGAVEAGGRTVAVLGNGLTEIYPPENLALAEQIASCGALVSELPMRSEVRRENFPSRNRIIAGMTLGTLVVEAPRRSGALITARLASEYNREIFAIPGRIQEPAAAGANALIRDGFAKLVTDLHDIVSELGDVGDALGVEREETPTPRTVDMRQLSLVEARVYEAIAPEPTLQDAVIARADLAAGDVLAAMTTLELKGLVRRLPGQMVTRQT